MANPPDPVEAVSWVFRNLSPYHLAWTLHLDTRMQPVRSARVYNLLYVPRSKNKKSNRRFAVINFVDADCARLAVAMLSRQGFELEPADRSQGMRAWFHIHPTLEASDDELLFFHAGKLIEREVAVRLYGSAPHPPLPLRLLRSAPQRRDKTPPRRRPSPLAFAGKWQPYGLGPASL